MSHRIWMIALSAIAVTLAVFELPTTVIAQQTLEPRGAGPVDGDGRPLIEKLGTIDCDLVETTPIVFRGKVYRFEWVRKGYVEKKHVNEDWARNGYFRFVDRDTGEATKGFGMGHAFGSAFVEGDTVYVTGTSTEQNWTGQRVQMWVSRDLKDFESYTALDLEGFGICNTSICKANDQYVMMFEIHLPKDQAGTGFTARFATSKDLRQWKLTPPECVYDKSRYSAPHALRYHDGWFYCFFLAGAYGAGFETHVARSRDLIDWETSPLNPVLKASEADRRIANERLSAGERERIATAENSNSSDIDFCEFQGQLIINYSWGDQRGNEFLAEALYRGTEQQFLKGWFPDRP